MAAPDPATDREPAGVDADENQRVPRQAAFLTAGVGIAHAALFTVRVLLTYRARQTPRSARLSPRTGRLIAAPGRWAEPNA
jgi:hypothetical protein